MASPSLRPLIDTCQKCSTSPANHEPRSPANGSFQNPGVCPQAVPSFPSPTPTVLFLALAPFSAQAKYRKPRSSVFLCSQTLGKRLLRRLIISKSWPRMCSRVHLNLAVVIFQIFIFVDSLLYFLAVFEILGQLCCCFWRFESSFFTAFRHYDSPFIVCSVITW